MEVSDADRRKEWSTNQSGMTQTVGTDADIIGVPRSVLAAACHIIRNSEHAESETAKAMRKYALSTQAAELDALRGEVERIAYFVEPHYKGAGLEAKADWIIEQLSHSSAKRESEIEEAEATIAQLRTRVAGLRDRVVPPLSDDYAYGKGWNAARMQTLERIDALLTQNEVG